MSSESSFFGLGTGLLNYIISHPTLFGCAFLLYIFVFTLSVFFSPPKKGRNPFKLNRSKARKELVTDQKVRDSVLRQGFLPKKLPERVDAIVIGSGIGGLTTAVLLARIGKKVVVLEQHDRAGGCCHTFIEKGFEFDVGIHYIGGVSNNSIFQVLIEQLTCGQIAWKHLDEDYDVVCLNVHDKPKFFQHRTGREEWRRHLIEQFPEEEAAIDKYILKLKEAQRAARGQMLLKSMSKWMSRFFVLTGMNPDINTFLRVSSQTTQQALDECTSNKDLQAVLCSALGDYGVTPKKSSFLTQAQLNNHYMWSASYPVGGASELTLHMIPPIESAGGRVLVRAPVSHILTDDTGRANGVRVHRSSGDIDIHAPLIISNTGLFNTLSLLPKPVAEKSTLSRLVAENKVQSSLACLQVFVGLNGSPEELGLKAQNIWAYAGNNYDEIFDEYMSLTLEEAMEAAPPLAFISMMAAKDPSYADRYPGKSTVTVVGLCNWEWFEQWKDERTNKRGDEYEHIKNTLGHKLWDTTLSIYPHLADKVEYFEVGSPLSNDYYLGTKKGELYGLDHNLTRMSDPDVVINLRAGTDIPGLYLAGQDIIGCGYVGGMYSGLLCASAILNRNLFNDLVLLRKAISMAHVSPSDIMNQERKEKDKHV